MGCCGPVLGCSGLFWGVVILFWDVLGCPVALWACSGLFWGVVGLLWDVLDGFGLVGGGGGRFVEGAVCCVALGVGWGVVLCGSVPGWVVRGGAGV